MGRYTMEIRVEPDFLLDESDVYLDLRSVSEPESLFGFRHLATFRNDQYGSDKEILERLLDRLAQGLSTLTEESP